MGGTEGLTPLMIACQENDAKKIEGILSSDQQTSSATDKSGKVAMHYCAERGDLEVFKTVYESDPSVMDKRDEDGYTPLTFAVIGGNGPVVEFLLEKGADINNVDAEKHSLVHWATVCGHAEILIKLLKKGSLPSTPDLYGAHALHYATQTATLDAPALSSVSSVEGLEILKILLKHGANVNCTDYEERTPLLWAASCGNCPAVLALLEAGADKHSFDKDHLTALHCAASRGHGSVIRTICKTAADVQINARDRNGSSPLFYAAALGHLDAVKALLEHGAMTDIQDKKLRTPAHCAAAKGQLGTLKLLLQHGASFALENYRGDLAIHEAVQAGSLELIEWMLSIAPTYTNATNHDGRTPLHLAAALGHLETCRLLVEKGAHKDALMLSKAACVTALDLAEEKGHEDVVEYLRSIEAKRCCELSPQSIVEEFKKHMETRKLAISKGHKGESTAEAQTDHAMKINQGVATSLSMLAKSKKGKKDKEPKVNHRCEACYIQRLHGCEACAQTLLEAANGHQIGNGDAVQGQAGDAENVTAVLKPNGVNGSPKKKKNGSKKTKAKDSGKNLDPDALDSSRTSAGVSEIASGDEEEETLKKTQSKYGPRMGTIKDENEPQENGLHRRRPRSADVRHTRQRFEEASDATSEPEAQTEPIKPRVYGSGSDATSSGGAPGVRPSGAHPQSRSTFAIDRFRTSWESSLRSSVHRYAEEKRIFQELANLKRLQIQYGNVQEEVIVKRLIDDFLRGYNIRAGDFQFNTFNSWEKFLYDQLKILYRKEKESLLQTYESKLRNQASLFEQKQAMAAGKRRDVEDRVDRLTRTYGIAPIPMQYSPSHNALHGGCVVGLTA